MARLSRAAESKPSSSGLGKPRDNGIRPDSLSTSRTIRPWVARRNRIRVETPRGISNPLRFFVGRLPEFQKPEPEIVVDARDPSEASYPPAPMTDITLPAVVNGQIIPRNPEMLWQRPGRFTPGTHIPIHPPEVLDDEDIDVVFILPWNLTDEITAQLAHLGAKGTTFVRPVPALTVLEPAAPSAGNCRDGCRSTPVRSRIA